MKTLALISLLFLSGCADDKPEMDLIATMSVYRTETGVTVVNDVDGRALAFNLDLIRVYQIRSTEEEEE